MIPLVFKIRKLEAPLSSVCPQIQILISLKSLLFRKETEVQRSSLIVEHHIEVGFYGDGFLGCPAHLMSPSESRQCVTQPGLSSHDLRGNCSYVAIESSVSWSVREHKTFYASILK